MISYDFVLVAADADQPIKTSLALTRALEPDKTRIVHALGSWEPFIDRILFPYAPLGEDRPVFEHELLLAAREELIVRSKIPESLLDDLVVKQGNPDEVIVAEIASVAADLAVMGIQSRVQPAGLGSTAYQVLRQVDLPVLLTRDQASRTIERIMVAVDLTPGSFRVFEHAASLALRMKASLEAVYVLPDPNTMDSNQLLQSVVRFDARKALQKVRPKIDALFDRVFDSMEVPLAYKELFEPMRKRRRTLCGAVVPELIKRAEKTNADLIVIGNHHPRRSDRSRLGQIADGVIRSAPANVMVVPVKPTNFDDDD